MTDETITGWVAYNPCGMDGEGHVCTEMGIVIDDYNTIKKIVTDLQKEYGNDDICICKLIVEDFESYEIDMKWLEGICGDHAQEVMDWYKRGRV